MLILLAAYPRSGVTFLRHVLEQMYGYQTLTVYPEEEEKTGNFFRGLRLWNKDVEYVAPVTWLKSHEMYGDHDGPVIHLVRDGRDAIASHALYEHGRKEPGVQSLGSIQEEMVHGVYEATHVNGATWDWGTHTRWWLDRPGSVVIRFEDLIETPTAVVREAVAELPMELTERGGRIKSFAELHEELPNFFRRGTVGGFKADLPENLQRVFWDLHGETMQRLGYPCAELCHASL